MTHRVPPLPMELHWLSEPERWSLDDGALTIVAGPGTDWFVDPSGDSEAVVNAPALLGEHAGDFQLAARVSVDFAATYDAGVLALYAHDRAWAKLCLEYSPEGKATVVSVVTRGRSDDCNSFAVDADRAWLRIARIGAAFAFHASTDGAYWQLVRHFAIEPADELRIGFQAQSPLGAGCAVTFSDLRYTDERLDDLRSGV